MLQPFFADESSLQKLINNYFIYIDGEYHLEHKPGNEDKETAPGVKVWDRDPEPATFSGLAFSLGFNSLQAFDDYIETGMHAAMLQRSRLRVEASYERKLHNQSAAGAIFALKRMGWNERPDNANAAEQLPKTLKVEIFESGPRPAGSEKDVAL